MIKTTPKNLLLCVGGVAAFVAFYTFVYFPISPLGMQLQNLKLAEKHANHLREKFRDDTRFQQVNFVKYTGRDGCLTVWGSVPTEDDFRFVTNVVESSGCPVGINYILMTSNQLVRFTWYNRNKEGPQLIRVNLTDLPQ